MVLGSSAHKPLGKGTKIMAMTFVPVVPDTTGRIVKAEEYTEEFKADFATAWEYNKANPAHALSFNFGTHKERTAWFNKAAAYGKTVGVYLTKVKGTGSDDKTHGKLTFRMEDANDRNKRVAEQKAAAERREILASYGYKFTRGIQSPEQVEGQDKFLKEHYKLSPEKQAQHMAAYRAKIAKK